MKNDRFWYAFSHEKLHTPATFRSGSYPKKFRMARAVWYGSGGPAIFEHAILTKIDRLRRVFRALA